MLKYVIAKEDVYYENADRKQFLTKDKQYKVIQIFEDIEFKIIDDNEVEHWFEFNDCDYLALCYEE